MVTKKMARIKAICEYVSVPPTYRLKIRKSTNKNFYIFGMESYSSLRFTISGIYNEAESSAKNNIYQLDRLVQKLSKRHNELYLEIFAMPMNYVQQMSL